MTYDDVLPHMGSFGRYQRRIYILLCLPAISCAFHKLAGVFILAIPEHRCILPTEQLNATFELPLQAWNQSYPYDTLAGFSKCEYYANNYFSEIVATTMESLMSDNDTSTTLHPFTTTPKNLDTVRCNKWVYDKSKFENSAVTDFDMVCNKSFLRASADSLFMLGVLLGSIIFGHLSDKLGRKPVFFFSLVLQVIFGILAGIAPEYITYTIGRIVVGATTSGVFLVAYVISMEMVGPKSRLYAGVICQMFFSVGFMLTALFAYFIVDWRSLQIALTLPGILFLSYWYLIPESTRWLLSNGRKDEAIVLINLAAKENKVTIPQDVLDNLITPEMQKKAEEDANKPKPSMLDLFKFPNLRVRTMVILFSWFVNSGTYYGLSWSTNNLGGNALINFVISGFVEIPAYSFLLLTLNRWGRKTILVSCMVFGGITLISTIFVPEEMNWLIVSLAMLGKMSITASYGAIYLWTSELFPTVIRNVGLGLSSMFARFAGIAAPFVLLLADFWKPLPVLIFGILAFTAGLLSLYLPETHNRELPETLEDGEEFAKSSTKKVTDVESVPEELKVLRNGVNAKDPAI